MSPATSLWVNWFVTALWPIVGKEGGALITPALMVFLACLFSLAYYGIWLSKHKMWGGLFEKKLWPRLLALGLFGTALPYTSVFIALQYTTPTNAAILNQVEILYSLVLAFILLGERPSLGQLCGSVMVICGVLIIIMHEKFSVQWKGDVIVLCTPWTFQISHIFAKKLPKDLPAAFISAARAVYGGLTILPVVIALAFTSGLKFENTPTAWFAVLFMGVIYYGISQPLWYKAIRNIDLSKATAIILSYPVMTFIVSAIIGTEKVRSYQAVGLILALCGAVWVSLLIKTKKGGDETQLLVGNSGKGNTNL
jgi:drug/metabolite transporter (DMT)-like permease